MRGSGWGMICILLNECEREREGLAAHDLSSMERGGYLYEMGEDETILWSIGTQGKAVRKYAYFRSFI